jgi:flagellar motor switch protein FliN/FliY
MPGEGSTHTLLHALAAELATAMGALVGGDGTAAPVRDAASPDWVVAAQGSGTCAGRLSIGLPAGEVAALAKQAMGFDDTPDDSVIADMLQEVCGQAFSSLGQTDAGRGMRFSIETPRRGGGPAAGDVPVTSQLSLGDALTFTVVLWGDVVSAAATLAAGPPPAPDPAHRAEIDLAPTPSPSYPNLDVILDIDLPLSVRFGQTEMTLDALTRLGPGSVIDLGRSPDDPVDVLVNGRMVARGEVVVVAGSYGVRIVEVVSAADRLRSMTA